MSSGRSNGTGGRSSATSVSTGVDGTHQDPVNLPVSAIRPEDGLGRQRDRTGHSELLESIRKFGVLTPITVRRDPEDSTKYLLVKGQGRTLASHLLGKDTIPAIVVDDRFDETAKVQQFLVENVARLRMSPGERAVLVAHARQQGEEASSVARRFGISTVTVRRLEGQLNGVTAGDLEALRSGTLTLASHAVLARHIDSADRELARELLAKYPMSAPNLDSLLTAIGWQKLNALGAPHRNERLRLLEWMISDAAGMPQRASVRDRLRRFAKRLAAFPTHISERTRQ